MSKIDQLWQALMTVRDEVALQGHLMSLDLQQEWHALEKRYHELDSQLDRNRMDTAKRMGETDSDYFAGDIADVECLIADFHALDVRTTQKQAS